MPSVKTVLRDIHDHGLDPKQHLKLEPGTKRLGEAPKGRTKVVAEPAKEEKKPVKSALVELPSAPPPPVEEVSVKIEAKHEEPKPVEAYSVAEVEVPKKKVPPKKGDKKDKPEEPPVS